jgi:hypothetical protein
MHRAMAALLAAALLVAPALAPAAGAQEKQTKKKPDPKREMPGMPGMSMPASRADTGKKKAAKPVAMEGHEGHEGHEGMAMPIPMPRGMPMMPGLIGLAPPVSSFLPGAGVDVATLPAVKPSEVARMKDGDTLDLTAMIEPTTLTCNPNSN